MVALQFVYQVRFLTEDLAPEIALKETQKGLKL
jgi:hypothetical protein